MAPAPSWVATFQIEGLAVARGGVRLERRLGPRWSLAALAQAGTPAQPGFGEPLEVGFGLQLPARLGGDFASCLQVGPDLRFGYGQASRPDGATATGKRLSAGGMVGGRLANKQGFAIAVHVGGGGAWRRLEARGATDRLVVSTVEPYVRFEIGIGAAF